MTAILAAASVLERLANDAPSVMQPADRIRRQASEIATLLDALLDMARVT